MLSGIPLAILVVAVVHLVTAYSDLNGSNVGCREAEGAEVVVPGITTVNPCYTCRCLKGIVQCEDARRRCPSTSGCYNLEVKAKGQCCDKCRGCFVNGTMIESGESWADPSNPCSTLTCFSGVLTTEKVECDATCSSPSPPEEGHCCPSCSGCRIHGHSLKDGESASDPADPCRECKCRQGQLTCQRKLCPVLSCPGHLQSIPRGECCPTCPRGRSAYTPKDMCMFASKLYRPAEVFQADTCTTCTCSRDLVPTCNREGCQPAHTPPSCTLDGRTHPHDSTWTMADSCRECRCVEGVVECTRTKCPDCPPGTAPAPPQPGECCPACRKVRPTNSPDKEGVCTVFGDPHYKTFDGRIYNFQGSCKYLLTRDCSEGAASSNFSIRITNDARDTVAFSWLRTVTVRLGATKVSLLQKMRVKVDGKKVDLPYIKLGVMSVMQDGYRVILRTNEGARILWDGVSFLELTIPSKMAGRMCGLCGDFNGDRRNDLIGRHGALLSSGQQFGNSWRVGGRKACSVLPRDVPARPPPCKQDWDTNIRSSKHCAAIRSRLFESCHSRINPEFYFKACRIDMCECPGTQCHCEVLTAYARECERAGVRIAGWRDATGCTNIIPFKYSGEHFTSSASSDLNATANEVLDQPGAEVFDDRLDELDLGAIGHALPAMRPSSVVMSAVNARRTAAAAAAREVRPHRTAPVATRKVDANQKQSRKQKLRRLRKLERRRQKERRRQTRARTRGGRRRKGEKVGSINGLVLERVTGRGGSKRRLAWRTKDQSRPPFEFFLKAASDVVEANSAAADTKDSEAAAPSQSSSELDLPLVDLSDLPEVAGRTPIPLRDSEHAASQVHRKNWKRRRSLQD